MTPFTLSSTTIAAINTALAGGPNGTPGADNINFVTAYQDIYNDIAAQNTAGNTVNQGTTLWFQQAPLVDEQQWFPSAQGDFIWAYTKAAATSEGATITNTDLQNASNAIALAVFNQLKNASYVFTDADVPNGFSTNRIIADDAGAGLNVIKAAYPSANLDDAIWGGTLFARTELEDPSYFSDYGLSLSPGLRDANAIMAGLFAGAAATVADGYAATSTGLTNVFNGNMDLAAIDAVSGGSLTTGLTWTFASGPLSGALAAGVNYIVDTATGSLITISSSGSTAPGVAQAYEPGNDGDLTFSQGTAGSGTLELTDGTVISVGGTADLDLTNIAGGTDTDLAALLSYLSAIGDPLTASQLDTDNFNYQNPTGTAYTVTGSPDGAGNVNFNVSDTPGAVITGLSTTTKYVGGVPTTVTANNIIVPTVSDEDLTQDTISNIQELEFEQVTVTGAEFNGFTTVVPEGSEPEITVDSSGSYSLSSKTSANVTYFAAGDWGGTTLTGNGTASQILAASLFGNDTLNAGSGADDQLWAGEGVDTLAGGSGGDIFRASYGLAAGSSVTGSGTGNTLEAIGDISGATVSDVQTLQVGVGYDGVTVAVTASELAEFTSVTAEGSSGFGYVEATTAGTYSSANFSSSSTIYLEASGTSSNVTLVGNNQNGQVLTGGAGNDTLEAGNGTSDQLIAGSGNTTMIAGTGASLSITGGAGSNTVEVNASLGTGDTLNGGTGGADTNTLVIDAAVNLSSQTVENFTTLEVGAGDAATVTTAEFAEFTNYVSEGSGGTQTVTSAGTYSLAGDTVTGAFTLAASGTGNFTLIGNNTANQTLTGSTGTDTITTGTGADDIVNSNGTDDTVTVNSASAWTNANGTGDVVTLNGTGDTVQCNAANQWINADGTNEIVTINGTNDTVHVNGTGGWVNLDGNDDIVTTTDTDDTVNINDGNAWVNITSSNDTATASANDDTVNVSASSDWTNVFGTSGVITVSSSSDTVDVSGASGSNWINVSGTSGYVFGTGTGNTINVTTGGNTVDGSDDSIVVGNGLSETLNGGASDQYEFGSTFGTVALNNDYYSGTAANGTISFGSGVSDENLWFQQSGNNLVIDLLDTTDQITISNWFSSAGDQVSSFAADSSTLVDSHVATLVSAMATYAAAHTSFNPQTATTMPTDTTLQNAIAAAW